MTMKLEIKDFDEKYLCETKDVLKSVFFREKSNETYNEWEFAENVLKSEGYIPGLCLIAFADEKIIGYNALTIAKIGKSTGLALGPLGVMREYQNKGVGTCLVRECIQRAEGYPWIILLGGDYYSRFGFESAKSYGIFVSDNEFDNNHLQILFLDDTAKNDLFGKVVYCSAFYDEKGKLL